MEKTLFRKKLQDIFLKSKKSPEVTMNLES